MKESSELKALGLFSSLLFFIPASVLMLLVTSYLIPCLSKLTGLETVLFWFVAGGLGIFVPLIITGILILKAKGHRISTETWSNRLRFHHLSKRDFILGIGGLLLAGFLSLCIIKGLELIVGKFDHSPPFMSFEPLTRVWYWLLLVWFPYWILNILEEEFLWRGVMLPRQEIAFGKRAWVIHGCGWGLFHITFGWQLLVTLISLVFIQSFIVQKTRNSWVGVIMHGGLNGPSFIAISLELM